MTEPTPDLQPPSVAPPENLIAVGKEWASRTRLTLLSPALRRIRVWIPVILVAAGLYAVLSFERQVEQRLTTMESVNAEVVSEAARKFRTELSSLFDDLHMLYGMRSLRDYLDEPSENHRRSLSRDFVNFALAKRSYAQVRLLDVSGTEVARVNFDGGVATAVSRAELQSKSKRNYVNESRALKPGEIYISDLDLNIEHGVVEQPIRPMLRLAIKVQDSGGKHAGLLVLNYEAQRLLEWVRETFIHPAHRLLLVNDDDGFVLAPDAERNWAFMFPETHPDDAFSKRFPLSAAALGLRENLSVRSDEGLLNLGRFRYPPGPNRASQPVYQCLLIGWTPPSVVARVKQEELRDALVLLFTISLVGVLLPLLIGLLAEILALHRSVEQDSRKRLLSVLESAADGIIMIDGSGTIEYFNNAAESIFGWSAEEVIGNNVSCLMPQPHVAAHDDYLASYRQTGERFVLGTIRELEGRRRDGSLFPLELSVSEAVTGDRVVFTGFVRDISARKQIEAKFHHQGVHDELTGLPNRRLLLTGLDAILEAAQARQRVGALAVVDLDGFMTFNEAMGHQVGDEILRSTALRLERLLRAGDRVARLAGDEFAMVLDDLGDDERSAIQALESRIEAIRDALGAPLELRNGTFSLTVGFGITLYPSPGVAPIDLLRRAQIATNKAKKSGRDAMRFYHPDMELEIDRRLFVTQELRRALREHQFVLYYQPKYDTSAAAISGLEALVRWQHPDRGLLPPSEFIEQLEENGLIAELGNWAIAKALDDLRYLDDHLEAARVPHVAVNISPAHFYARDFLTTVNALVDASGLSASRLEIEITENLLLDNADLAIQKMRRLRNRGMSIALDDFGTGYSSLSYFQQLPVDRIKIDRAFVRDVDCRDEQAAMVLSVLSLATARPVQFIAEGVETEGELAWLKVNGCNEIQGFLFSRPLPIADLLTFLEQMVEERKPQAGGAA